MEADQLKLEPQHFPLSTSLSDAVQARYASTAQATMNEQPMELEEVLGYLRSMEDFSQGPMDAIRAQTDAMGDPSLPTPTQVALLEWLQNAYALWREEYPVEEPLATELGKIIPAAAALAITDPGFLVPGAHPVHRLLDTLHAGAVGWQPSLGRAGQTLEKLVNQAAAAAGNWLNEGGEDLANQCEEIISAALKDQDRALRMTQRLVETEKGRLRSASARWKGAEMINKALETHRATAEIGKFLTGPWYDSAQLVLLKFGADSDEWAQMTAATESLLDSLQIDESADEARRQELFEVVTRIPKEIKRWLLSLHMDSEAIADVVGLIEFTHLKLLRQQTIELVPVEPLFMEGMNANRTTGSELAAVEALEPGQWFEVTDEGQTQRVQLVLKLGQEQRLQFANKAGLKAMEQSYEKFCKLLNNGRAVPLKTGTSFSLCLAQAAGLDSVPEDSVESGPSPEQQEQERREQEQLAEAQRQQREQAEALERQREQEETERLQREQEAAEKARRDAEEAEQKARQQAQEEREREEREEAERLAREQAEASRIQREQEAAERARREQEEAEQFQRELEAAGQLEREQEQAEQQRREQEQAEQQRREQEQAEQQRREQEQAEQQRREQEQAEQQRREQEQAARQASEQKASDQERAQEEARQRQQAQEEAERARIEAYLRKKRERKRQAESQQGEGESQPAAIATEPAAAEPEEDIAIELPMGTWLGFHDGDTPMMAKLAVHDPEQDSYIFVNREGIKMRSLNKRELLSLIDNDMVDILRARSSFRDEVRRAKEGQD